MGLDKDGLHVKGVWDGELRSLSEKDGSGEEDAEQERPESWHGSHGTRQFGTATAQTTGQPPVACSRLFAALRIAPVDIGVKDVLAGRFAALCAARDRAAKELPAPGRG